MAQKIKWVWRSSFIDLDVFVILRRPWKLGNCCNKVEFSAAWKMIDGTSSLFDWNRTARNTKKVVIQKKIQNKNTNNKSYIVLLQKQRHDDMMHQCCQLSQNLNFSEIAIFQPNENIFAAIEYQNCFSIFTKSWEHCDASNICCW